MMNRYVLCALLMLMPSFAAAQMASIRVEPAMLSVSSQGPTTAILTFSGVGGYTPAEGLFCGQVVALSDAGARCEPGSIFGQAQSGAALKPVGGVFTDVVSVSASVAQRAYEAALAGQPGRFFYVRRFVSPSAAAPDQYVAVVCVLGAGGASAPFALTNVRLRVDSESPVVFVRSGEAPPRLSAEIAYTGTGRLQGRWEVVSPGEEVPTPYDLLTEGSLPAAQRGLQRRYREIERFNVLLLPTGRFTLTGPDPARLPTSVEGSYTILLRVEASDDGLRATNTAGATADQVFVRNGAAAGFPMPTLRYIVERGGRAQRTVRLRLPASGAAVSPDSALTLSWVDEATALRYRVEVNRLTDGRTLLSAFVAQGVGSYEVPPFVLAQATDGKVKWRVVALGADGNEIGHSETRRLQRQP